MHDLLLALHEVGATGQVAALADRAVTRGVLDDPSQVVGFLSLLRTVGAVGPATALAAHVRLDDQRRVAELLAALRRAGASAPAHQRTSNTVDRAFARCRPFSAFL